ncbi:MAG: helix-turn-helix domain-containing protein [Methyloprofundus sp.]|nr:helix-turn-helix domain-containing protein [Methyloprofundus sp.]
MNITQAPFEFLLKQPQVKKVSVPSGTIISNLGDQCDNFIILQKGLVRVYRPAEDGRAITLYHIGAGESCILTASCILNSQVFPAIAEIEQDAEGLVVSTQQMLHWLKTEHQWQQFIFSLLSQRMADLIGLVDALAFRRLDSRLAAWLLEKSTTSQEISITHQIIAEELASSREVISRLLKEFERNNLIKLSRGKIEIIDPLKICKIK